jgi:hypothetical protein
LPTFDLPFWNQSSTHSPSLVRQHLLPRKPFHLQYNPPLPSFAEDYRISNQTTSHCTSITRPRHGSAQIQVWFEETNFP